MKKLTKALVSLGLVFLTLSAPCMAQDKALDVEVSMYGQNQGLTISGYKAIVNDSSGLLWVLGAHDFAVSGVKKLRLQYYDGVRFKNTPPVELEGWNTDYEYEAFVFSGRNLMFVSSSKKHFFVYNPEKQKLEEQFVKFPEYDSIGFVKQFQNRIIFELFQKGNRIFSEWKGDGFLELFSLKAVNKLLFMHVDQEGILLFYDTGEITKFDYQAQIIFSKTYKELNKKEPYIAITARGLEVFIKHERPFILDTKEGTKEWIVEKKLFETNNKFIYDIKCDAFGNTLYFFRYPFRLREIYLRSADGKIYDVSALQKDLTDVSDIVGNNYFKVFFAISTTGLFKFEVDRKASTHYFINEGIRKIKVLGDSLYVSTENGGIYVSPHEKVNRFNLTLPNLFPRLLEKTKDGSLLVNDVLTFSKINKQGTQKFNASYPVLDAILLNERNVIAATFHQLLLVDIKTWQSKHIFGIDYPETHKLLKIMEDQVWLCHSRGLDLFNTSSGTTTSVYKKHPVLTITENDHNEWYAGCAHGQLLRIQKKQDDYSLEEEIHVNAPIVTITKDKKGRLWLGTYQGIFIYNPISKTLSKIPNKFLPHIECNRHAAFYDEAYNRMYIGTVKGLSIFEIDHLDLDVPHLHFGISAIRHFDAKEKKDTIINVLGISETGINLDAYHRYVTVWFAPGILHENNISYEYCLLPLLGGKDTVWIPQGKTSEITLSNLKSGSYNLIIKANVDEGRYDSGYVRLQIHVGDFFYNTWWFYILIFAGTITIFYIWLQHLKQENVKLEAEVGKRTLELKKDKETIQIQAEKLTELDQLKTSFYQNISHELKTPLSLITGPLETIKSMESSKNPQTNKLWNLVEKNVSMLMKRVDELLEINRLQNKNVGTHLSSVQVQNFLDNYCGIFFDEAKRKDIRLTIEHNCPGLIVMVDEDKFGKVIQNLIANALKYCPAGSIVSVKFFKIENEIHAIIQDNGPGIPKKYHSQIFDKFFQIPDAGKVRFGSGIGLAIVKEYVELMSGKLELFSDVGKGTTFEISIPFIPGQITKTTSEDSDIEIIKFNKDLPPETHILVVEDNEDLQTYLSIILTPVAKISVAGNGKTAMEMLQDGLKVDLILSDIMMPEMDGFGLLQYVKSDDLLRKTPFIFLTARNNEGIKLSSLRLGVDDFLTKPFSGEELLLRIYRLLKNQEIRKATKEVRASVELNEDENKLSHLQNFVRSNLDNPTFSVESMAIFMQMSERTLRRFMQKEFGLSPKDFIMEMQMNVLRELHIENPYFTLKELGNRVGFLNTKYMARLFFERFGYKLK